MNTGETYRPGAGLVNALRGLPDMGNLPPDDLVAELARNFRKHLGPTERLIFALSIMHSLDPDSRDALTQAAERLRKSDSVFRGAWRHG